MRKILLLLLLVSHIAQAQVTTGPSVTGVASSQAAVAITGGTINGVVIGGTTAAAVTGTSLTATTGLITAVKGAALGITIGDVSTNNGSALRMQGTSAGYNWLIDNNTVAAALSFTPSTATGGVTYTTPTLSMTPGAVAITGTLAISGSSVLPALSGTSASIGGGALIAGACATGTAAVTNATTAMTVLVSPTTYPGDGNDWQGYVSSAGTVTVKVCAIIAGTPTASTYNVRVIQ